MPPAQIAFAPIRTRRLPVSGPDARIQLLRASRSSLVISSVVASTVDWRSSWRKRSVSLALSARSVAMSTRFLRLAGPQT